MKMPKLQRGDFVEIRHGKRTCFHDLASYTKQGKYRDYPIKRETMKDLYYQDGWFIYNIRDSLDRIVSIWRSTGEGKIERIWKNERMERNDTETA